jgi:hypothetical protein
MGFDQTGSASRLVKRVFDPFLDERDRNVTFTHGLGGPCYGWKKSRAMRPGTVPLHHRVMDCRQVISFNP